MEISVAHWSSVMFAKATEKEIKIIKEQVSRLFNSDDMETALHTIHAEINQSVLDVCHFPDEPASRCYDTLVRYANRQFMNVDCVHNWKRETRCIIECTECELEFDSCDYDFPFGNF